MAYHLACGITSAFAEDSPITSRCSPCSCLLLRFAFSLALLDFREPAGDKPRVAFYSDAKIRGHTRKIGADKPSAGFGAMDHPATENQDAVNLFTLDDIPAPVEKWREEFDPHCR